MSPIRGGGVDTMKARLHPSVLEFGRYFVVSLIALGADILVLLAAAKVMHYLLAAAMAFIALGDGPSSFSFEATLMISAISLKPSSRATSSIGLPGS